VVVRVANSTNNCNYKSTCPPASHGITITLIFFSHYAVTTDQLLCYRCLANICPCRPNTGADPLAQTIDFVDICSHSSLALRLLTAFHLWLHGSHCALEGPSSKGVLDMKTLPHSTGLVENYLRISTNSDVLAPILFCVAIYRVAGIIMQRRDSPCWLSYNDDNDDDNDDDAFSWSQTPTGTLILGRGKLALVNAKFLGVDLGFGILWPRPWPWSWAFSLGLGLECSGLGVNNNANRHII